MPDETTATVTPPATKKGIIIATPEVQQHTEPAPPTNPDYDGEGHLTNEKLHAANQAAREAILNLTT